MAINALTSTAAVATATTPTTTPTTTPATTNSTTSTSTSNSATDSASATLNYNSFLKLLITEMQNQDPTDPMDSSQQMSQLASFSAVEQQIKTNTHLENLLTDTSLNQASSLIGKTITSADGTTSGVVQSVAVNSDGSVATLVGGKTVTIESGISIAGADSSTTGDTTSGNPPSSDPSSK
jgi:flagellar basal-body rod modification protein FlgD